MSLKIDKLKRVLLSIGYTGDNNLINKKTCHGVYFSDEIVYSIHYTKKGNNYVNDGFNNKSFHIDDYYNKFYGYFIRESRKAKINNIKNRNYE